MAEIIDCTKCTFYNNGKCDNPNGMACNCANNAVCYFKELKRLEQEKAELKQDIETYKQSEQEASKIIAELKAELQKYKDMEAKGLEEFKDVGGCWGCGLQLQLNQDLEDIKQLKAEKERLKEELDIALREENRWKSNFNNYRDVCRRQYQTLQEIKAIVCGNYEIIDPQGRKDILKLINKAEEE